MPTLDSSSSSSASSSNGERGHTQQLASQAALSCASLSLPKTGEQMGLTSLHLGSLALLATAARCCLRRCCRAMQKVLIRTEVVPALDSSSSNCSGEHTQQLVSQAALRLCGSPVPAQEASRWVSPPSVWGPWPCRHLPSFVWPARATEQCNGGHRSSRSCRLSTAAATAAAGCMADHSSLQARLHLVHAGASACGI